MKITKNTLKDLIKEELAIALAERAIDTERSRGADDVFSRELDRALDDLANKYAAKGDAMVGTVTQAYADGFNDGQTFGRNASNALHELPIEKKMYEAGFANAERIKDAAMMPQMQADADDDVDDFTSIDAEFAPGPYKSKKHAAAAAASRGYAGKKKARADVAQQRTGRGMPLRESRRRKNLDVINDMIRMEIKKLK